MTSYHNKENVHSVLYKILLRLGKADVCAYDKDCCTPLHLSAVKGSMGVCKLLVSALLLRDETLMKQVGLSLYSQCLYYPFLKCLHFVLSSHLCHFRLASYVNTSYELECLTK